MQAGKLIPGRDVFPDALYSDKLVEKLVNYVMLDGKKSTARRIVYDAFNIMEQKTGESPVEVFNKAMKKLMPNLETRSRRVGGSSYQVPYEVPDDRQRTLALRWLMMGSRARNERTMAERLAAELMDATNEQGKAYEKRQDTHRMAEANRPFAHYRW
jgi:small subunit ribosomal protein S7